MTKKIMLFAFTLLVTSVMFSQTIITGVVKDAKTGETLPGANIKIENKSVGTNTDFDGNFTLTTTEKPPFFLEISMLGYQVSRIEITKNNQKVEVSLEENATALDEVVISASRTPERILESPVTVERLDARAVRNSTSPSFYDALENLKGVDINTNSLTFKSINTRGFAAFSNTRFMQLVDGMDNSAPGLNFPIGNLLGISELDVESVEVLPGASSALYGANAFNGIMFMRSTNPFDHQGVSASYKLGMTSQEAAGNNNFYEFNVRMATAFSDKLAGKMVFSIMDGTDWYANDSRNTANGSYTTGDRFSDPNYDGLNVYGDEVSNVIPGIGEVSRTGYTERELMDYNARSVKFSGMLNYRPWGDDRLEIIWNTKYGRGNTVYQGSNRYYLNDFVLSQQRLEFRGRNFFLRGYMNTEDAGDSYDSRFTGINLNSRWKSNRQWFTEYAGTYVQEVMGGATAEQAHSRARVFADRDRLIPGTPEFQAAFNEVIADPNLSTGSRFQDQTKFYHADANYNFRDEIDWAEFQIGALYRQYSLNSSGTIFTDNNGKINYYEFGFYTQMQKNFLEEDRLKLTASIRYDGAKNFDENYSPRISLAYAAGEDKNHNFRASFQTGFRYPTTQDQYIGLDAGRAILIGSAPDNLDRYTSLPIELSATGAVIVGSPTIQVSGRAAYQESMSVSSLLAYGDAVAAAVQGGATPQQAALANANVLQVANPETVQPEKVTAFELGYRGILDVNETKVSVDMSAYYNSYQDFISSVNVFTPLYGNVNTFDPSNPNDLNTQLVIGAVGAGDYQVFAAYTNSAADISSYGAAIAVGTKIFNGFNLDFNYTYAKFDFDEDSDPDFEPSFNTPEHKFKLQIGHPELFKNFGFNVNFRWQDKFLWQSTFHDAIIDARTVLDAQVNYTIPKLKSVIKLGGTNLTGEEYYSAPGVGLIGSMYYVSLTINN